jgi:hypothetical protein
MIFLTHNFLFANLILPTRILPIDKF